MISKAEPGCPGQQSPLPLEALIRDISAAANIISSFLQNEGTNPKSQDEVLAGSCAVPPVASAEVVQAKRALLEATTSLQQLLLSPADVHLHSSMEIQRLASYRWLTNFNIPDHVPLDTPVSYASIAASTRVPEDQLIRLARLAMTGGLFHEPTAGHIAHTPLSAGLRTPSPLRETMLFLTETNLPTSTKVVEMTRSQVSAMEDCSTNPQTAFQIAHNTTLAFFPYLSTQPQIASRLAAGMRTISAATESHVSHVLASYDWSSLPSGTTILDLGGSRGHISMALATQCPQLHFIVQDLPDVIAEATKQVLAPNIEPRVTFQAHSFLEPQPVTNHAVVDLCLIRQCLQNWPHRDALRIIRALVPCLEPAEPGDKPKRLLINNVVVPVPFSTRRRQLLQEHDSEEGDKAEILAYGQGMRDEAIARVKDVAMMQLMGGAERDLHQWESLLRAADSRLEIVNVTKPEGSVLSLLEVKLGGEDDEALRMSEEGS